MTLLIPERIEKAQALFHKTPNSNECKIITTFENLGNEIGLRYLSLFQRNPQEAIQKSQRLLVKMFNYTSLRTSDLFFRLEEINWLQDEFKKNEGKGVRSWHIFGALAIKDFHFDVSALMDSLATVIIQVSAGIKSKDQKNLPGFPDIQSGTKRSYRKKIPLDVINIIDATDRWWPSIKKIRDILTHREHYKLVFSGPNQGILFQIYVSGHKPKIIDDSFMWTSGRNVVDFRLYSSFVTAEILLFMEEIGVALAGQLNLRVETLTPSWRIGEYQYLIDSMDRLIDNKKRIVTQCSEI